MKKLGAIIAVLLIASALILTSGCLPKWTITVSRLAQSNFLYNADDISQVVVIAQDDFKFMIFDVSLTNNGLQESDIKEDLIFAIYDETYPLLRYENYYSQSAFDIFDEIGYIVEAKDTNEGSVFVPIPFDMDLSNAVFKVIKSNYDVLYSIPITGLPYVSDYPASW